jgi:hypothetical protein
LLKTPRLYSCHGSAAPETAIGPTFTMAFIRAAECRRAGAATVPS